MSKQSTLAAFGFTKIITHRGKETNVTIPKTVSEEEFNLKCQHCMQRFKNQQGLSVHLKCKQPAAIVMPQTPSSEKSKTQTKQSAPSSSTESNDLAVVVEISEPPPAIEKRRGRDVRKSIPLYFKVNAITAVEQGEKTIDVAEQLHVSRGQISK